MPTFGAYFSTGDYGKLWFEAESIEQAENFIERVHSLEMHITDLPNLITKIQGDETEISDLEEMEQ